MKDANLTSALEAYKKGRRDFNASIIEESLKLLRFQRDLEEKLNRKNQIVGKSVNDTCKLLLDLNENANKFRNDFKIPDKRFWYLTIHSLAQREEWAELEKFSKSKKSPIGYAPFVDVCLKKKDEALHYLPKVSEDLKVKYYIKAG